MKLDTCGRLRSVFNYANVALVRTTGYLYGRTDQISISRYTTSAAASATSSRGPAETWRNSTLEKLKHFQ